MKKNLKAVFSTFAGMCLITVTLSACAQAGTERAPGRNMGNNLQNMQTQGLDRNNLVNVTTQLGRDDLNGNALGNTQGNNMGMNQANQQQMTPNRLKADNIKRQLTTMDGVRKANVIVMGNTALIGFEPTSSNGDTGAVRNNIIKRVKTLDKTITNVTVSESSDIMDRMNRLGTDITNNKPVKTITEEFNSMIQGLTPAAK